MHKNLKTNLVSLRLSQWCFTSLSAGNELLRLRVQPEVMWPATPTNCRGLQRQWPQSSRPDLWRWAISLAFHERRQTVFFKSFLPPPSVSLVAPHRPRLDFASCSSLHLRWSLPPPLLPSPSPSPPTRQDISGYTVRYRTLGVPEWNYVEVPGMDLYEVEQAEGAGQSGRGIIEGLMSGQSYEVQVRTLGRNGRTSSFSESLIAATSPPGNWPMFAISGVQGVNYYHQWCVRG